MRCRNVPSPKSHSSIVRAKSAADFEGLSKEQIDAIEHFVADYNAVDQVLRKVLGSNSQQSFASLVKEYARKHMGWRDADLLLAISDVRNAIIHGKTEAYRYLAVPTPAIVQELRACRDRLTHPVRVVPTFQRRVETISRTDTLARVLKVVKQRDYSQFPVLDDGQFQGLLTENGITRWLANHVTMDISLVELDEIHVAEVLRGDENRRNYHFLARDRPIAEVRSLFATHPLLEAVLITASGKVSETLLGIATRWDAASLP